MSLSLSLARSYAATHPGEVAAELESRSATESAAVLRRFPPDIAALIVASMTPNPAAAVFVHLEDDEASEILTRMQFGTAMALLRRVAPEGRQAVIEALPPDLATAVRTTIGFPADAAGALMDPRVLAVTSERIVGDALETLRKDAAASHDDLYVIDRSHGLVGVVSIHELLQADPKATLQSIMRPPEYKVASDARRDGIIRHPGWRHVHSLPVVDAEGRYLGAIRYQTFRRLEAEHRQEDSAVAGVTAKALSELFVAGLGGVLGAIASATTPTRDAGLEGDRLRNTGEPGEEVEDGQDSQ